MNREAQSFSRCGFRNDARAKRCHGFGDTPNLFRAKAGKPLSGLGMRSTRAPWRKGQSGGAVVQSERAHRAGGDLLGVARCWRRDYEKLAQRFSLSGTVTTGRKKSRRFSGARKKILSETEGTAAVDVLDQRSRKRAKIPGRAKSILPYSDIRASGLVNSKYS